uniref:Microtubule associated protein 1B n=1 Tax=Molossus molossus TaxID=27622 RepID=A0A7J8J0E5_MOLMO|nr:microtubule associated protein 1B [Molossus molossus]
MATVVVEAAEPELSGSITNPAASTSPSLSHRFLDSKFYLLVVVGEIVTEEHLRRAIGNIELGIRSWDTNLIECNLDQELKLFVSRHSARFSPEVPGALNDHRRCPTQAACADRAVLREHRRAHSPVRLLLLPELHRDFHRPRDWGITEYHPSCQQS